MLVQLVNSLTALKTIILYVLRLGEKKAQTHNQGSQENHIKILKFHKSRQIEGVKHTGMR